MKKLVFALGAVAMLSMVSCGKKETQKFAEEYAAYYKEVLEAAKAKDAAKSAELAQKAQDLAKSAQEKMTKMTPEDAKVWGEWAQKIATEVAAAAQAQ